MTKSATNLLYYGDNLDILRRYVKDETVDLVYLDPPFNSNTNYNVLFAEKDGSKAASQIFTVAELLAGKKIEMPPIRQVGATFKKAPKATEKQGEQPELQM